ncbi:DUF4240 domain-containing protein [Sphaerisporangium album]|nr:DUF4240 domain-containing protein [Sphaerisporangium album]
MGIDEYWSLVERSRVHASDLDGRAEWLVTELARGATDEIVAFRLCHAEVKKAADTWPMWGAAYLVNEGWCSDDVFWYFQSWLIGLGREAYERVTVDPDALVDVPEIQRLASDDDQAEPPEWEILDYVADDAYERATGEKDGLWRVLEERGIDLPVNPAPDDDGVDEGQAQRARSLPRLSQAFPPADTTEGALSMEDVLDRHLAKVGMTRERFLADLPGDDGPSADPAHEPAAAEGHRSPRST